MFGLSLVVAHAVGVPALLMATLLNWSEPVKLREANLFADSYQIASNSRGQVVAIWYEYNDNSNLGTVVVSAFSPGADWSPPTVISDGGSFLQVEPAVVIGDEGTVIAAWSRGVDQGDSNQIQLIARKFVPGVGWGSQQLLSTNGETVSLAIAPDGRAHAVFYEDMSVVARTLNPGEEMWSQTSVLGQVTFQGGPQLVAGNGFAYASFVYNNAVEVAMYTTGTGWQPASVVSSVGFNPQLVTNNGHAVLSWLEGEIGLPNLNSGQRIQRLTEWGTNFILPRSGCPVALLPDGTVVAACTVQGDPVPGCFETPRGAPQPQQAYYSYIEAYRLPLVGDRIDVEVISDYGKRVNGYLQALADAPGDAFVVWDSDIPCQAGSQQTLTRVWSPDFASWQPITVGTLFENTPNPVVRFTADGLGILHALWGQTVTDYNQSPPAPATEIFTQELPARAPQSSQSQR